jgi:hypothetical protein
VINTWNYNSRLRKNQVGQIVILSFIEFLDFPINRILYLLFYEHYMTVK